MIQSETPSNHDYESQFRRASAFSEQQLGWSRILLKNIWFVTAKLPTPANRFLRDSLGRSIRQTSEILRLATTGAVADANILLRSLADRFLLLNHLHTHDEFDVFEDWCELQSLRHRSRLLGLGIRARDIEIDPVDQRRLKALSQNERIAGWRRPRPEATCKRIGRPDLYLALYDYASFDVHPVASDYRGVEDALWAVGAPSALTRRPALQAVHHATFVHLLLQNEAICTREAEWATIVTETNRALLDALGNGWSGHEDILPKAMEAGTNHRLVRLA